MQGSAISGATIVRRLADFSADYGLEAALHPEAAARADKRQALDQAYGNSIFGLLTRLARLLIQANRVDEVLEKVLSIAFDTLQVDRGFILLKDPDSGELVCELSREGERVELRPESEVPVSRTMLEAVMRERVALLTYDAQADQRLATGESIRIHQIRSAMCAPLWSSDRIIGVMQVDSPFHAGTFNEGDLDLFTALANYAAVAVERIRYAEQAEFERQVRSRLERYHSPSVIELVLSRKAGSGGEAVRTLEPARVTVLFADVVGFTPLAENLPPEQVAEMLEGFFTHSVEAIFEHGGTLDKFIGDCVMAFFGAPVAQEDHAQRAVRAAIAIQRDLDRWNAERAGRGRAAGAVAHRAQQRPGGGGRRRQQEARRLHRARQHRQHRGAHRAERHRPRRGGRRRRDLVRARWRVPGRRARRVPAQGVAAAGSGLAHPLAGTVSAARRIDALPPFVLVTGNADKQAEAERILGAHGADAAHRPAGDPVARPRGACSRPRRTRRGLGSASRWWSRRPGSSLAALNGFPGPAGQVDARGGGRRGDRPRGGARSGRPRAEAVCALLYTDGVRRVVGVGRTTGHLVLPGRGPGGFGWDPVFLPDGESATYGELPPAVKDRIGHRGRAWRALVDRLRAPQTG